MNKFDISVCPPVIRQDEFKKYKNKNFTNL